MPVPVIAAGQLMGLLEQRHSKDIVVTECKTGSTWLGGMRRMDMWVLRTSYTNPAFLAYEIKVSRGDFLQDNKWRDYLPYCTEFYFVCPWKLIDPAELPAEAGLIWASRNLARLFVKKKAPQRDVTPPVELFMYLLMTRARITREHRTEGGAKFWREWLEEKDADRKLGRTVGSQISRLVAEMQSKLWRLEATERSHDDLVKALKELGVDPSGYRWRDTVRSMLGKGLPPTILRDLRRVHMQLEGGQNNLVELIDMLDPPEDKG